MGKIRYTLKLPEKFDKILNHWSYVDDVSQGETLRRAIVLYDYLYRETVLKDKALIVKAPEGEREIILS